MTPAMTPPNPYVLCIGVANVDVIAHVDTGFLVRNRVDRGTSTLMRSADITRLIAEMDQVQIIPGGCAANTACGIALLGIETEFAGMIHNDEYGRIFRDAFPPYGVRFTPAEHPEKQTSLCLTLVTPDKDRSFVFSPDAASWFLSEDNLPERQENRPLIVYTETNLFRMTSGTTRQSMLHAVIEKYHTPDCRIILNLIDTEITIHHRHAVMELIRHRKLSLILSNGDELCALLSVPDRDEAVEKAQEISRETGQVFITTLGKDGAMMITADGVEQISGKGIALEDIIDTVGAGDQFSAGFIAGLAQGKTLREACLDGANKAVEILGMAGARPPINDPAIAAKSSRVI